MRKRSSHEAKWARAAAHHDRKRTHPTRPEHLLREAVKRVGLDVVAYEYEVHDDKTNGVHWFDVAVNIDGALAFIDLVHAPEKGGVSKRERQIYQEKRELCERWGVPLLQLQDADSAVLEASVRHWLRSLR